MGFRLSWNVILVAILLLFFGMCFAARPLNDPEALLIKRHEAWMTTYGRTYKDAAEKAERFKLFKNTVEFVENSNAAGNHPYTLGVNQFADMTTAEVMACCTGYKPGLRQIGIGGRKAQVLQEFRQTVIGLLYDLSRFLLA